MKLNDIISESQSTFVKGMSEPERGYLVLVANKLRQILGISPSRKVIINTNQQAHLFGSNHNGSTIIKDGVIVVFLNEVLVNDQILLSLAHEMVHAYHLDTGEMEMDLTDLSNIRLKWKGKPVKPKYSRSSEWEVDAHSKERGLFQQLMQDDEVLEMREMILNK